MPGNHYRLRRLTGKVADAAGTVVKNRSRTRSFNTTRAGKRIRLLHCGEISERKRNYPLNVASAIDTFGNWFVKYNIAGDAQEQ
jgi:hypothetical protein